MPSAFLSGTVTVGSKPCPGASVHIAKVPTASLDGSFVAVVHKVGTYTITAHAPGCPPVVTKVAVAKLDGKAVVAKLKLKASKA
jgi:hypothetical protein